MAESLTAEQKRRIEENKRKAIELLALKKGKAKNICGSDPKSLSSSSNVCHSVDQTAGCSNSTKGTERQCELASKPSGELGVVFKKNPPSGTHERGPEIKKATVSLEKSFTVKLDLTLITSERFKAVCPYDKKLIEIFKGISSKTYDAKTQTWNFHIKDLTSLVVNISNECKYVQMTMIPKAVVTCFVNKSTSASPWYKMAEIDWGKIDRKLADGLMKFQREGVEYAILRNGRVLIADDMGLGKTLQAIAVAVYYRCDWPILIICPSSVRQVWSEAIAYWVPSVAEEDINVVFSHSKSVPSFKPSAVNIVSYELAVKMQDILKECQFKVVIADESHFLKNYKTARCKAIIPLLKSASRVLLLSGTPALSRPLELFTQLTAVDKTFNMSYVDFGIRYCNGTRNHWGWDFSGASHLMELQLYLKEKTMIRRMKYEVLDQLPEKRRQMVAIEHLIAKSQQMKQLQKELSYAGTLKAMEQRGALLGLYEETARLKLPAIQEYITERLESESKFIVFGHHKIILDSIEGMLSSQQRNGYIRIDGRTAAEQRQSLCDQFQHDEKCLVALLSITTANAGITLTAASSVIFAELFWNPGILVQAEDRAHRIGQKNSVVVHYLVARGTVDDFIWPMIQSKLETLNQAGLAGDNFTSSDVT